MGEHILESARVEPPERILYFFLMIVEVSYYYRFLMIIQ